MMAQKDHKLVAHAGILATINYEKYQANHDDVRLLDHLSLAEKHQPRRDAPSALTCLIFGLRMGVLFQIMFLSALYFFAHHEMVFVAATGSVTGMLQYLALWIGVTVLSAVLSLNSFPWIHQLPQQEQIQIGYEDFHLMQGCIIGAYVPWLLFDLVAIENGFPLLGLQSAVLLLEIILSKYLQRKRRTVNDDLLISLDLL